MQGLNGQSRWLVAAGLAGLAAGSATAGTIPALTIDASSTMGTGSFQVDMDEGTTLPDGTFVWVLDGPTDIVDSGSGQTIAHILFGSIMLGASGNISHSFVLEAANADTHFILGSGLSPTATINNPMGRASAGVTLTDVDGNGANLTGMHAGGDLFQALYNNSSSVFTSLIGGPFGFATAFDSQATSDEYPAGAGNFAAFPGPVSQIGINWDFVLSANDSASGTSVFVVVPGPGAGLGFLVGAGLLSGRRRR